MDSKEHTFCVDAENEGTRLDQFLAAKIGDLSRSRARALILSGAAMVDGSTAKPSHKVRLGESIRIVVEPREPSSFEAEDIPLDIAHEDVLDLPRDL